MSLISYLTTPPTPGSTIHQSIINQSKDLALRIYLFVTLGQTLGTLAGAKLSSYCQRYADQMIPEEGKKSLKTSTTKETSNFRLLERVVQKNQIYKFAIGAMKKGPILGAAAGFCLGTYLEIQRLLPKLS